ncbi:MULTISPECIES: hypothetical protein [Paenibacillus]|uniref:Uncharacterized protein n=1 Tax=Paenibacillus albilobatus TaxID=2716884 RepID=A0A919XJI7_9BACL|nr:MULTISPECIES: hypothetical protein [Paenibacillus]GIO33874.1 hypothetical protein J2TS6_50150 [Paenibacillus albilobatus]
MPDKYKSEADWTYERYQNAGEHPVEDGLPDADLREVNAETVQSITSEPDPADAAFYVRSDMSPELGGRRNTPPEPSVGPASDEIGEEYTELEDVPDADDIQKDSPIDPVATIEDMHGTDLINGFDGDETE